MNKVIRPRLQLCFIAAMGAAIFLANPASSLGSPPITVPSRPPMSAGVKTEHIDLRPTMKQMHLQEGQNVVYSRGGVILMAEVKGGKVIRWTATDVKGNPLPIQIAKENVTCEICYNITMPDGSVQRVCVTVDCKLLPNPLRPAAAQ
jgi:hypothetical protein